jgi:phosphoribosylaminoimidazolecarboxamide formyltransferase/IMP cyclohydrolase
MVRIQKALISTYYKNGLDELAAALAHHGAELISTGGTLDYLQKQGYEATGVESITEFPEMLGGRVKTLHPKVFGGILHRRNHTDDLQQIQDFDIPAIDLVVVNLYPFSETVANGGSHADIIEKIDIGGVSLIRAAAKNVADVCVVADPEDYRLVAEELMETGGAIRMEVRQKLAAKAFRITASYDAAIAAYLESLNPESEMPERWTSAFAPVKSLRYGENPHQKAAFYGNLAEVFEILSGKELSYNNLVDAAAAWELLCEFSESGQAAAVIVKHTNACGVALANTLSNAYGRALSCDPVSAFGGVIALNQEVNAETARLLNDLFFEILLAPGYQAEALEILKQKKNRILVQMKSFSWPAWNQKSVFNGVLVQERDSVLSTKADCRIVTQKEPTEKEWKALLFAEKVAKHTKSNTIVLANEDGLLASGTGQTSRIDALKQAIAKAGQFGFDLKGAAMASDAFFPFSDCVELAAESGISCVIQPGGSIRDQDSVDACNRLGMSMVVTGIRHFKH